MAISVFMTFLKSQEEIEDAIYSTRYNCVVLLSILKHSVKFKVKK